ncbi:MAG: hypothetical protein AAF602_09335 [Myxococcota bacterium]
MVASALLLLVAPGCREGFGSFVDGRLPNLCTEAYGICGVTAGCALDPQNYVTGTFPGARRVVVRHPEPTRYRVLLYLTETTSPGTEFSLRLHEPDCTFDPDEAGVELLDVDLIEEAGLDRTLIFEDLAVEQAGEHLLEVFSDATVEYLMAVEPIALPEEEPESIDGE